MMAAPAARLVVKAFSTIVVCWLHCAVPDAARAADVEDFVARLITTIRNATTQASDVRHAAQRFCMDISGSLLDVDAMMATASAGAYRQLSAMHRSKYRAAFLRRVVRDCATNATSYMNADVELAGVRVLSSGDKIIGTRSRSAGGAIIMWQVRPGASGAYVVTDVLVDGRSAMLTLRDQSSVTLEKNPGDVSALIESLER